MPARIRSESLVEKDIGVYAKRLGMLCYKFVSPGHAGVPDRMFVNTRGQACWLEIKREGGQPSALQLREIDILNKRRAHCARWVSSLEDAIPFLTYNA